LADLFKLLKVTQNYPAVSAENSEEIEKVFSGEKRRDIM